MKQTIGQTIRRLRRERGLTQEELAEQLNLTAAAVSRWENDTAMPDISTVVPLCHVFGVSADVLFGMEEGEGEIASILAEAERYSLEETYRQRIAVLEEGLRRHPNSYALMMALAEAYSQCCCYPEWREKDCEEKILRYGERVAAECPSLPIKYRAIQILCYVYRSSENYERIRVLAEQMPEIEQTRPALLPHSFQGHAQLEGLHEYYLQLLEHARGIFYALTPEDHEKMESSVAELTRLAEDREKWYF